jgi:periplasmic divalent cation tolerance protein
MAKASEFRVVLVTCGSMAEARKIGRALVEKRLAACVNILGSPVESIYRWKGTVEAAREWLMIIKTGARQLKRVEEEVRRLHSYETPEFLVVGVAGGSKGYLSWLAECFETK